MVVIVLLLFYFILLNILGIIETYLSWNSLSQTGSKPDLNALAGVLRGLALYLHHFPEGIDDDPQLFTELYKHIHKVLNPDLNLPRRDAQRGWFRVLFFNYLS